MVTGNNQLPSSQQASKEYKTATIADLTLMVTVAESEKRFLREEAKMLFLVRQGALKPHHFPTHHILLLQREEELRKEENLYLGRR